MNERTGFKLFYFLLFASFSGYVMFRNVYLQEIGFSGTQMGIIGFLLPFFTMLAQPIWGLVADWKRIDKQILYLSAIVAGGAILFYPLGPLTSNAFLVIGIGTVLFAIFRAPAMPIANALVLSTGFSYEGVRVWGSIAFGITGLAMGYLIGVFMTELVFYAYTIGMIIIILLLLNLPIKRSDGLNQEMNLADVRSLLDRDFSLLIIAAFCIGLMTPAGSAFFSVYVREIGHPDSVTGIAWLAKTIAEAVIFLYIARRGGSYRRLMAVGGVFYLITYLLLLSTSDLYLVIGAQFLLGIGYALFNLASVNLAFQLAPAALQSTAQSLLMVGGASAGISVGELLTGVLVDLVGVQQMYGIIAGIGIAVTLLSLKISSTATEQHPDTIGDISTD